MPPPEGRGPRRRTIAPLASLTFTSSKPMSPKPMSWIPVASSALVRSTASRASLASGASPVSMKSAVASTASSRDRRRLRRLRSRRTPRTPATSPATTRPPPLSSRWPRPAQRRPRDREQPSCRGAMKISGCPLQAPCLTLTRWITRARACAQVEGPNIIPVVAPIVVTRGSIGRLLSRSWSSRCYARVESGAMNDRMFHVLVLGGMALVGCGGSDAGRTGRRLRLRRRKSPRSRGRGIEDVAFPFDERGVARRIPDSRRGFPCGRREPRPRAVLPEPKHPRLPLRSRSMPRPGMRGPATQMDSPTPSSPKAALHAVWGAQVSEERMPAARRPIACGVRSRRTRDRSPAGSGRAGEASGESDAPGASCRGAFALLTQELAELGCEGAVLGLVARAASDEVRHAETCRRMAVATMGTQGVPRTWRGLPRIPRARVDGRVDASAAPCR